MTDETNKILIVDDEESNRKLLTRLLSRYQYSLYTAENGTKAVELARKIGPDLILLDVMMPELDGAETCRILKNMEETSLIPVIMLTACLDKDVKLRCLRAGANDFLAKPVDNDELQLRVENLLEFKRHAETRKWNELLLLSKITLENKNRELEEALQKIERAQSQLVQQEKMATIGQMAAGIAHEINNPMSFITCNINTLGKYMRRFCEYQVALTSLLATSPNSLKQAIDEQMRRLRIDYILEETGKLVIESLEGADRVRKIVQNLKSFSRIDQADEELSNINECLESTINIVWSEIKYVATLRKELGDIPKINCYPQQLNQVFMNLLVNAAHAISGQGEITVCTWHDAFNIFVSISDTGSGIPEDIQQRIFEPFFTTKESGKGTGLGLSISNDIVSKHGGDLMLASQLGQGTTFTVRLPFNKTQE